MTSATAHLFSHWQKLTTAELDKRISEIRLAAAEHHFEPAEWRTLDRMRDEFKARQKTNAASPPAETVLTEQAATVLAEHVAEIRRLGKRVVEDAIEIGRRLAVCKAIVGHGNWLGWLEREFGWSEATARNLMRLHELAETKSANFADLSLPISTLYLLAAPSTPEKVRTELIERSEAGERLSTADVKQAIAEAKSADTEETDTEGTGKGTIKLYDGRTGEQTEVPNNDADDGDADEGGGDDGGADDGGADDAKGDLVERHDEPTQPAPDAVVVEPPTVAETVKSLFARSGGAELYDLIPAARRDEVVAGFLSRLTVESVIETFGEQLRAALPAKPFGRLVQMDPGDIAQQIVATVGKTKAAAIRKCLPDPSAPRRLLARATADKRPAGPEESAHQ